MRPIETPSPTAATDRSNRLTHPIHCSIPLSTRSGAPTGKVLGLGVCGVDLLAYVDKYPEADAKIRTADFQVQGGGNAGNTLTGYV